MALWGYFDESGDPRDPNVHAFAIAGAVADEADWEQFNQAWSQILADEKVYDRRGIQWFHSKDLRHGHGAFEGWTQSRRISLFERLRVAIRNHVRLVVAAYDVFDRDGRRDLRPEYLACHEYVIRQSVATLHADGRETVEALHFVFATRPKSNPTEHHRALRQYLRAVAPTLPSEMSALYVKMYEEIGELGLSDPRVKPELQAADLIASEIYQWLRSPREGHLPEMLQSLSVPSGARARHFPFDPVDVAARSSTGWRSPDHLVRSQEY